MKLLKKLRTWFKVPVPYRAEDFSARERFRADYRRLAGCLLERFPFESVLDVGCANGFLLEEFAAAGRTVAGLELSPQVLEVLPEELREVVEIGDFSRAHGAHDLVCCVEVAEHIEPARTDELVEALTGAATRWIYFTAAPPGQGGLGHINCRPHEDWIERFEARGWSRDADHTDGLRACLDRLEEARWLQSNTMVFRPAPRAGDGADDGAAGER